MLPVATPQDIGAVKVGSGLGINPDGTLYVVGGGPSSALLDMSVTYGSPRLNSSINDWAPSNVVTVYGPSKMQMLMTANSGATFVDHNSDNDSVKFFTLDDKGRWQNHVQLSNGAGSTNDGTVLVTVAPYIQKGDAPQNVLEALAVLVPLARTTVFYPMATSGDFQLFNSYGYTRGVPSDGVTPCQISVSADYATAIEAGINSLTMQVTSGDAVFGTKLQTANPEIGKNNMVVAELYSTSAGVSTVQISVPKFPDVIYVYATFFPPPK
jgi:hypothetical protein